MPKSSLSRQKTAGRVMHEFKHGEPKSGSGGKAARKRTVRGRKAACARVRGDGKTKAQLYARAKRAGIPSRPELSKQQLEMALSQ